MSRAKAAPAEPPEDEVTVREWGDWKVVQAGNWEVSVSPDGLLMLPRHLHPREFADFVRAGTRAAELANEMIAANTERAKGDDRRLRPARAIVTEGAPPAGALPMIVTPSGEGPTAPQGSIGRRVPGTYIPPGSDVPAPMRRR